MKLHLKLLSLMALLLIISCTPTSKELRLTYVKTPLNVPAIINFKQKILANSLLKQKINTSYLPATHGSQLILALASKEVDIVPTMGNTSALIGLANGADIKIISMFSRSPKSFVIVTTDPSIKTINDLKGKKIGGPKGTVLYQLLLAVLQQESLTITDIDFISLGVQEALTSLFSKDIDIALLVGSASAKALEQGAHLITTGEGWIDGSTVSVVRSEFLKSSPELVKSYLNAHYQSLEFMNTNQEHTINLVSQEVSLTIDQVRQILPDYNFDPTITETDIQNLEKTQDFLYNENLITNKINIKDHIITNI